MNLVLVSAANKTRNQKAAIFEIITAVLCSVSFWLTVLTMLGTPITTPVISAAVILPTILYLCGFAGIFGRFDLFYTIMTFAVCLLFGYSFFSKGLALVYNLVASALNSERGLVLVPFSTDFSAEDAAKYQTAALILLVFFISAFIASGIRRKRPFLILVSVIVPIVLGLLFNLKPSMLWLIFLILSLTIILIICSVNSAGGIIKVSGLTVQMALALFLFLCLYMTMFSTYSSLPIAERVRNYLDVKIEEFRYAPDLAEPIYTMPNGDLNSSEIVDASGAVVMSLTMEQPSGMYLRSFVGEKLSYDKWESLDVTAYTDEYLGIIEYLSDNDFYPFSQLGEIYAMDSQRIGSGAKLGTVKVENYLAYSDVLLTPYEVVVDENLAEHRILNNGIFSKGLFGEREYAFTTYNALYDDYLQSDMSAWVDELVDIDGYDEYLENESVYRAFVYDNYLDIPDKYEKSVGGTTISDLDGKRYEDVIVELRKYFDSEYEFSYDTEFSDDDSLGDFINVKKSGHDPFFASYATLLFRSAGIPARYVEGYYLDFAEMEAYADSKDVQVDVYDSAAHAWVEIYVDKIGWIPIEVTPGYYIVEEVENDQITTVQNNFSVNDATFFYEEANVGKTNSPSEYNSGIWKKIFVALAIIIIFILSIIVVRCLIIMSIKRQIARADSTYSTHLGYRFLIWDLKRKKIFIDINDPYAKCDASVMLGDEYVNYLDLIYKEFYSTSGLNQAERKQVSEYVLKLVDTKKKLF